VQRGGRRHDRRGRPRLRDPLDDLLDVAGQAQRRGDRLAEATSERIRSEEGLVERSRRMARPTAPASTRPLSPTWSIALCVSEPAILCVLVSIASAPCHSAVGGSASLNPKCVPHDWSTTSGTPAACATSAQPAMSAAMPYSVGETTKAALASGASRSAASSAAGVTQWVIPSSSSSSGPTKLGRPPLRTRPVTIDACELRWATTRAPSGASARHSVWLPCVAPLVRNQLRAAPKRLGGELLRALKRRRRRADVDPVDVLRHVGGEGVDADRLAHSGIGARALGRGRAMRPGTHRRRRRRGTKRWAVRWVVRLPSRAPSYAARDAAGNRARPDWRAFGHSGCPQR
jgi:hypothetical protein